MIIDLNGYYGKWPYWPLRQSNVEAMLEKMDRYGISRVFLCSLRSIFTDPQTGNAEIKEIVKRYPHRFSPAFTYSPFAPGRKRFQEDCEEAGACLIKFFPRHHTYVSFEEPFIEEILGFCGEKKIPALIPYRIMMNWGLPMCNIQNIGRFAKSFPETPFIVGSVNYLLELQSTLDVMRRRKNVFVETSGMMAFREIEYMVRKVGAERILHGSAIPLQNPAIGPLKIHNAKISDADKERILFRNAQELFNLSS